ncbi:TetR/AcrR family transcriptional regulator [Corynebacterium terpenotabidum]|uniref:Transcriptional regulator n=1 Tax=Corynebacterium terpenotabidum Y-11 TaxID=1200352 RepID=S4XBS4_9CORY|nr:TetR/AcrR family transcriptional regulator [Corynebacterium terpenotabidum]AGP30031.1 transcriptional regulator [Corynebacterium terpenotabidum Y-11]
MADSPSLAASPHRDATEEARAARQDVRTRQLLTAAAKLMQQKGSPAVSMKSVADEAGVSVGLIYRYYPSKEALVKAVIVGVLDEMAYLIPRALEPVDDPVRRVVAAFTAYAEVIRDNRRAAMLTYRETHLLDPEGQKLVKSLELQTGQPMYQATQDAIDAGFFRPLNARVFAYDLLIVAHSWALKHWYFAERMTFEEFVACQVSITLASALKPEHHTTYADLLADPTS